MALTGVSWDLAPPVLQGMVAAYAAVRLRARGLCALLRFAEPDVAVNRLGSDGKYQALLESHPDGLYKEGASGPSVQTRQTVNAVDLSDR